MREELWFDTYAACTLRGRAVSIGVANRVTTRVQVPINQGFRSAVVPILVDSLFKGDLNSEISSTSYLEYL